MSATLKLILIVLGFASVFLLIGLLLRSRIRLLQKLFLPASVIGGIVGLLLVQIFSRVGATAEQVTSYVSVMDALPAIRLFEEETILQQAWAEFERSMGGKPYVCPIPDEYNKL